MLYNKPSLKAIIGPPNSGISTLIKQVVEQTDQRGPLFHALHMNLRGIDPSSPDALYEILIDSSSKFFNRIKKFAPSSRCYFFD